MLERRFLQTKVQIRQDSTGDQPKMITGMPIVYNQKTMINDWCGQYQEEIASGACEKSIREDEVVALFNHEDSQVLGRNTARTLTLREERDGVSCDIVPPTTHLGPYVHELIQRGDVTGMSFGFQVVRDEWTWAQNDNEVDSRKILEVRLIDVSPVTFPAYKQTSVSARSRGGERGDQICSELQRLAMILVRSENGKDLIESDHTFARTQIERLQKLLERRAKTEENSEQLDQARFDADLLRKKLDLIA